MCLASKVKTADENRGREGRKSSSIKRRMIKNGTIQHRGSARTAECNGNRDELASSDDGLVKAASCKELMSSLQRAVWLGDEQ